MSISWLLGICLLGAAFIPGLAQPGFAQKSVPLANADVAPTVTPSGTEGSITLDVVVSEKSHPAVSGLQQQDFTLLDNKQPQKIVSFRAVGSGDDAPSDPPVEVVLLIDAVNTSFQSVSFERIEVEKYLRRNGGVLPHPVSLVFLSDMGVTMGKTSSRDGNALIAELNDTTSPLRTIGKSQGFYGAGDRFQLSLRALERLTRYEANRPGRKLVIWISPGWPLLSGPQVELSARDRERFFKSVVDLSAGLRQARITLYSIDPLGTNDAGGLRTTYYEQFLKGVRAEKSVQIGNLGLQVLAFQSGGKVLNSDNDVTAEIAECVNDASSFYEISFEPLRGDGPNEYHALELKVDKHGLTAHTRTGYYAQPAEVTGH